MFNDASGVIIVIAVAAILGKAVMQLILEQRNCRHVLARAKEVPDRFKGFVEPGEYQKMVAYTVAKARYARFEIIYDVVFLLLWLLTGVLPLLYRKLTGIGDSVWVDAAFLLAAGMLMAIPSLPLSWYWQFTVEERFGFNRTTPKLWIIDRLKGLLLGILIGWPLVAFVLKLVHWSADYWWLWAWAVMLVFQLIMMVLAPMIIVPLFNKLTPLPEGELKARLLELGSRLGFHARNIQVIDGSKRSTHSNAFFTGFGKFRRIILFDTLIEQLSIRELEAVLAHEIGHYKLKHIPKLLLVSAISMFLSFWIMGWLAKSGLFAKAFGFPSDAVAPVLLLFALVAGPFTFWLEPFVNRWSRKYEYQADAYARDAIANANPLISALRKLNLKNLSNLTPDPLYSAFYYSHPTLIEREASLVGSPSTH